MRPLINPALRQVWRDEHTLQVGIDPDRAHVLTGLDAPAGELLSRMDGTRTDRELLDAARTVGLPAAAVEALIAELTDNGLVVDAALPQMTREIPVAERLRLAPDVAAWTTGAGPVTRALLDVRRRATVVVEGAGRLGTVLASLLAAAAVGRLVVTDDGEVREGDLGPGGHSSTDVGAGRAASAARRVADCAPSTRVSCGRSPAGYDSAHGRPDLVVLSPDGPAVAPGRCEQLLAAEVPHLVAVTYERVAVVGPLVLPGRSPCTTCLELHRVDRDRGWPIVSAQLAEQPLTVNGVRATAACDVVLASLAAALAASAVLSYLDAPVQPHPLAGAMVQLRPPELVARRRSWSVHPSCGCAWDSVSATTADDTPVGADSAVSTCTSRTRRIGAASAHRTETVPPAAATASIGRSPIQAPHQPPARAPSGRTP